MGTIKKAVIPAAGLGTRFLPATKAIPKEMIPIIDTPMIQHIAEEAVQSGIEQIVIVTARHKESIENHFDYNYELDDTLEKKGKSDLLKISQDVAKMCEVISIRQKNPLGLGHAVLTAAPVIGNEPFAVLLGDDLIDARVPCTRQLMDIYEQERQSVIGVMEVPLEETSKYGIVGGARKNSKLTQVEVMVEKPEPKDAPSQLATPGRYILDPVIFDILRRTPAGKGGEIQLTDALQILAKEKGLLAFEYEGDRYDTGDRLGFIDATLAFALKRPELKSSVLEIMNKHLREQS
ncbi:MAG: UTP--glucose-1-phosphate uridylyltransferase [Bdellovibrionaceae bacterium]|nr:UTP--glucose-1-phosphate uridylyltransferase [Pseudobdellovibrionaceae bacterium]|tara:strand:- start:4531 stop:5406 length:876 start_codon:yes stop_codon:yes gene_type:complete